MRQLCNATYTMLTASMEEKDQALFDRKLIADDPDRVSYGTQALMDVFARGGRR